MQRIDGLRDDQVCMNLVLELILESQRSNRSVIPAIENKFPTVRFDAKSNMNPFRRDPKRRVFYHIQHLIPPHHNPFTMADMSTQDAGMVLADDLMRDRARQFVEFLDDDVG